MNSMQLKDRLKKINKDIFNKALLKTFNKRNYYGNPFVAIDLIWESELIRLRWKNYQRKYEYAKDIDFDDILVYILKIIEQKDTVVV